MRVNDIAKKFNVSDKEVLSLLKKGGFDVSNRRMALSPNELRFLEDQLKSSTEESSTELPKQVKPGIIPQDILLGDLASEINVPASEIIMYLLRQGIVCKKNQK